MDAGKRLQVARRAPLVGVPDNVPVHNSSIRPGNGPANENVI